MAPSTPYSVQVYSDIPRATVTVDDSYASSLSGKLWSWLLTAADGSGVAVPRYLGTYLALCPDG